MAPVTGGVADGNQDGFVFFSGLFEGFRAPGVPVDGIMGMLQEVRAFFVDESIGNGRGGSHGQSCKSERDGFSFQKGRINLIVCRHAFAMTPARTSSTTMPQPPGRS